MVYKGTLKSLNLSKYEILFTEPLHNISNHIKNLYQEIPYHVPKNKKKDVRQILDISFNGKDAEKSFGYGKSLFTVAKWFSNNLPEHFFTKILLSMCNIQAITYYSKKEQVFKVSCNYIPLQSITLISNTDYFQDAHLIQKKKNQYSIA